MVRRLLYLNGLAALGVVLNHTTAWAYTALFWWTDRYRAVSVPNFDQLGGGAYLSLRVIEQVIIFTIPAFLFVSGFFIAVAAGRGQQALSWNVIGARIKNLVIPYLLWSFVMLALDFALGDVHSPLVYLRILLTGGATPAFYYVPLLCQLYILSPLLLRLARTHWKPLFIGLLLFQVAILAARYPQILGVQHPLLDQVIAWTPGWFFPSRIFWFVFGLVIGLNLNTVKSWIYRFRWVFVGAAVVLFFLGLWEWELLYQYSGQEWIAPAETITDNLFAGVFILGLLAFEKSNVPMTSQISFLGSKSFGIYLVHSLVLEVTARLVYHFAPGLLAFPELYVPLLFLLGLFVPLALMAFVSRSPARRFYTYQFG